MDANGRRLGNKYCGKLKLSVRPRPVPRLAISWLAIRRLLLLDAVARVAAPLGLDARLG